METQRRPLLSASPRWALIDSVRGFALSGILLVHSVDITAVSCHLATPGHLCEVEPTRMILDLVVHGAVGRQE